MGVFTSRYSESKSSGGSRYIDWGKAGVDGKHIFNPPKNGSMFIDIVPYYVTTEKHPLVKKGTLKIGDLDYCLDIWVHRRLGAAEVDVVCPKRNYNLPCPACDLAMEFLRDKGNQSEEYKATKAKRRVVYNVLDAEQDDIDPMVFEVSHFLFEKELIDRAEFEGRKIGVDFLDFADPEEGFTIECRTVTEKDSGFETTRFKDFRFEERESGIITAELMDDAVQFDRHITAPSPEEIEDIIFSDAGPKDDDEEETEMPVMPRRRRAAPAKRNRKPAQEQEQEQEQEEETEGQEQEEQEEEAPVRKKRSAPKKKSTKKSRKPAKEEPEESEDDDDMLDPDDYLDADEDLEDEEQADEAEDEQEEEAEDPDTGEDEEEETEPPKRQTRKRSSGGSTKSRRSSGSSKTATRSRSTSSKSSSTGTKKKGTSTRSKAKKQDIEYECPSGYQFGVDTDEYEECDDCEIWDKCSAAYKRKAKK